MKSRRGISTVIGAVFFIIIFTTTISYVTYNMNLLNNFASSIITKTQADADANHESFLVTKATTTNNKFDITVQNTGNIALNITRLYILNKTDVSWGTHKYALDTVIFPGHSQPIGTMNLPLYAKANQGYDLKLVTTRGNTLEFFVNSASQEPVYMQLYTLPATGGPNNFNTTLLFAITNNMTNGGTLTNVVPVLVPTPFSNTTQVVQISGPTPSSYPLLPSGDTAFFQWKYKITGTSGQTVNFKTSLMNGYLNNFVSQNVTIINTPSGVNIGHGTSGLYSGISANNLQFKNIVAGSGITLTPNSTDVTLSLSGQLIKTDTITSGTNFTQTGVQSGDKLLIYAKGDITGVNAAQTISLTVAGVVSDQVGYKQAANADKIPFMLMYSYVVPSSVNVPISVSATGGTLANVKIQVTQLR